VVVDEGRSPRRAPATGLANDWRSCAAPVLLLQHDLGVVRQRVRHGAGDLCRRVSASVLRRRAESGLVAGRSPAARSKPMSAPSNAAALAPDVEEHVAEEILGQALRRAPGAAASDRGRPGGRPNRRPPWQAWSPLAMRSISISSGEVFREPLPVAGRGRPIPVRVAGHWHW